jgi:hypothetical protein
MHIQYLTAVEVTVDGTMYDANEFEMKTSK